MKDRLLEFEWDPKKAASNLRKHRVSFEEAASVLSDEYATIYEDPDHSQHERRYLSIGASKRGRLLIIAYSHKGVRIRIINARRVTKQEREMYEEEDR
jgi:uncharacterized DUF497 family protein